MEFFHRELFKILTELFVLSKHTCVLCIHTEHKPHTKDIECFERVRTFRVVVLLFDRIVQLADKLAGFLGYFHFTLEHLLVLVYNKAEAVTLFFEVAQLDFLIVAFKTLFVKVVNAECLKI